MNKELNSDEILFIDTLIKEAEKHNIINITYERLYDDSLCFTANGYTIGKISLKSKPRWMQIISENNVDLIKKIKTDKAIENIDKWISYAIICSNKVADQKTSSIRIETINNDTGEPIETDHAKSKACIFMNININDLIEKHSTDGIFLKNGCASELVQLTGIEIEDAKDIINNILNRTIEEDTPKSSIVITHTDDHVSPQPLIKNSAYMSNQTKKTNVASCPKCGSTSLTTTNKKISIGRAIVGGALINPVGAAIGAVTSKKMYCVCMNCGHKWKL